MLVTDNDQVGVDPTGATRNLSHRIPDHHFAARGQPGIGQLAHTGVENRLIAVFLAVLKRLVVDAALGADDGQGQRHHGNQC